MNGCNRYLALMAMALLYSTGCFAGSGDAVDDTTEGLDTAESLDTTRVQTVTEDLWFPSWISSSGEWLELQRDSLSESVIESAKGIDAYLARDNVDESLSNESHLRLQLRQTYSKSGERTFEFDIKARLRLPNSKRRIKLTFDSNPDDFERISDRQLGLTPGSSSPSKIDDTAIAGIGIDKVFGDNWDSSYSAGMRLRFPFDPYIRADWTHNRDWGELWRSRFKQRFSFFHIEGWKSDATLSFYRPLSDTFIFETNTGLQYLDSADSWDMFQSLSLHQRLSTDTALEYQVGVSAISRPSLRTSAYWVRTELRHRLYKDWLYAKVSPELHFSRDDNFDLSPLLRFELEVYFGATPK